MKSALQLFVPGDGDDPREFSLRQAYDKYLLPDLVDASAADGTLQAYGTAIRHWEKYSGNPAVGQIERNHATLLRDGLLESGMAAATVRKTWAHLRAILRRVAQPISGNPRGEGIIACVPWVRLPKSKPKLPRLASHSELNLLYDSCRIAIWPSVRKTGVPAPELWRCFLVLVYNYGPRTLDLWRLPWSGVDWERGLIRFCAEKTSKLQGLPLNAAARAHLERVKLPREKVFWPTGGKTQFYREWRTINAAAGISVPLECRDLRETCASNYEAISPGVGSWILGHGPKGITQTFYVNPTPQIIEAVHKLPQPAAFLETPASDGLRQKRLF